jgi:hypothetical protein
MGLSGALLEIASKTCPHCKKQYGDTNNGKKGHSKKQFIKCLYTANYNLYHLLQEYNKTTAELDKMSGEIKEKLVKVDDNTKGEQVVEKVS